jgi:hypothetical protein
MENNQNLSGKILSNKYVSGQSIVKNNTVSVNRTSVDFDKTDIGDECFRLIKVSQDGEHMPVTLSSDSPDTFRMAIGVNKLVFEDTITFTPVEAGTFVHIRFTPDRMGNHTGRLILKTTNEQQIITLNGKGGSYIATPASEQIRGNSGWKWVAISILLIGAGYTGYMYRCQLVPSLCDQPSEVRRVDVDAKPSLPSPISTQETGNEEVETKTVESLSKAKRVPEVTKSAARSEKRVSESQAAAQNEQNQERKAAIIDKPKRESKPVQKIPSASEESDLEQELNRKPGNN